MNEKTFKEELSKIGIVLSNEQLDLLEKYYELVVEYNKVMNLTGITEKEDFYLKHYYDSLTLNKLINLKEYSSLCDLGSGAGFPGIVLKIAFPNLNITLVDSLKKRTDFLNIVIEKLNLKGIEVVNSRIEDYSKINREQFDLVTARAVASNQILLEIGVPLVKVDGHFISMKGKAEDENLLTNIYKELSIKQSDKIIFKLPIENSERTLTKFTKLKKTILKYPRNFDKIKKRPL